MQVMTTTPSDLHMSLAQRAAAEVRACAARYGWRQADIAAALGLPQSQVSARHRGSVPWRLDELEALADAWGIEVYDLLPARDAARAESVPPPRGFVTRRSDIRASRTAPYVLNPGRHPQVGAAAA